MTENHEVKMSPYSSSDEISAVCVILLVIAIVAIFLACLFQVRKSEESVVFFTPPPDERTAATPLQGESSAEGALLPPRVSSGQVVSLEAYRDKRRPT